MKRKLLKGGKKTPPKKYRIMFEGPNSEIELPYNSIKNIFAAANTRQRKVISKTSKTKEIQRDDDVEKITVERFKIKNDGKKHSKKPTPSRKIASTLRHALEESMKDDDDEDDYDDEENIEKDTDPFTETDFVAPQPQNDGFTLTITKNGEKVGERRVDNAQAKKMLEKSNSPELVADEPVAAKKQSINGEHGNNIDVEVVVDGKEESKPKAKAKAEKHGSALVKKEKTNKIKNKTKTIKLQFNEDLIPKSVTYDLAKKKADIDIEDHKHELKNTKKPSPKTKSKMVKNLTDSMFQNDDEDEPPILPFLPFTGNEANFPGVVSENFIPSFGPNSFPNFESPFMPFPSYGGNERAAFNEKFSNHFPDSSFETPVRNPPFSVAKRSELTGYGYQMPFQFYSFPRSTTVPLARNYRSVDFYDEDDNEDDESISYEARAKREVDDINDSDDDFYLFDKNDATESSVDDPGRNIAKVGTEIVATKHDFTRSLDTKTLVSDNPSTAVRHGRRRRSIDAMALADDDESKLLIRQKRNEDYDDDDDDDGDGEDNGPHVVKRSAIFSELYPSKQPTLTGGDRYRMTKAEKRSAIRKALALEKSLRKNLFSMKQESSSALDIIKRVHNDIANADARDLRILEKELANMNNPLKPPIKTLDKSDDTSEEEEPINNFIKLIEQTENSSTRKTIPDEEKQNPDGQYFQNSIRQNSRL